MSGRKQLKGKCAYCAKEISKSGAVKHLAACEQRRKIIVRADGGKGENEMMYHLRVQADGLEQFWLDLEMRGSAALKDLDGYLRAIWLECCGHMSGFSTGGWGSGEIPKTRCTDEVFEPNSKLTHIYDFGTSSVTLIKVISAREGKPVTRHPIALMMRNLPPEYECLECGRPAFRLCTECLIEEEKWGVFCDEHARTHPHDNYGKPEKMANSPRVGMCGYDGPAEPPY